MRLVKAKFTLLNWFHISLAVTIRRFSMSSLSLEEAALSLWERRILSSVNLAHDSGTDTLEMGREKMVAMICQPQWSAGNAWPARERPRCHPSWTRCMKWKQQEEANLNFFSIAPILLLTSSVLIGIKQFFCQTGDAFLKDKNMDSLYKCVTINPINRSKNVKLRGNQRCAKWKKKQDTEKPFQKSKERNANLQLGMCLGMCAVLRMSNWFSLAGR